MGQAIYDSTNGIPTDGGLDTDLFVVGNLDSDQTACLTKWLKNVNDHSQDPSTWLQGNPGNSGTVARVFDGNNVAMVTTASGEGLLLVGNLSQWCTLDVQLVAFGISLATPRLEKRWLRLRLTLEWIIRRIRKVHCGLRNVLTRKGRRAQLSGTQREGTNPEQCTL